MLLRGREKQVFSILSKDQEGENERKEKKAARGKSGNWQLLLPYLYPVSNPKAESHIQSQVWGDPSEHNITMALLQHFVPPAPLPPPYPFFNTCSLTALINLFSSYLELSTRLAATHERICYSPLGFSIDDMGPHEVTLSICIPPLPPYQYPFISSRDPSEEFPTL